MDLSENMPKSNCYLRDSYNGVEQRAGGMEWNPFLLSTLIGSPEDFFLKVMQQAQAWQNDEEKMDGRFLGGSW